MGIFFRHSRAANSAVGGPIRQKFELIRALMHVIIACNYKKGTDEKQPRKSGDTVFSHYNPICYHGNQWMNLAEFQLIQALMYVIITCKYEKDPIKNSREKVETSFFQL